MKIILHPQRRDGLFTVEKRGEALVISGQRFDFSTLPEGAAIPADAISSDIFCGPVERINGDVVVNLILPHGPNPSQAVAFPQPITVQADGDVPLPRDAMQEKEQ